MKKVSNIIAFPGTAIPSRYGFTGVSGVLTPENEQLLDANGWTVKSEEPLVIEKEGGSMATKEGAIWVIQAMIDKQDRLRKEDSRIVRAR